MTLDERRRVYAEAIAVYGEKAQLQKVTEELGELITEVSRIGTPREEQLQVLDELADVYVMLEQLAMIASISDRALDDRITYKVGRLCRRPMMSIRRDYTNGSGYVCPTENAAIGHLDKPKERIPRPARNSGVLHEQELNRMSRPTPMQALARIAEQEAEALKKARALWNALAGIAAVMDYSITAIELKPKGGTNRYYKDATTKTLEKRCGK